MAEHNPSFLFYTLGDANVASSRVRAYWVSEELESLGAKCELFHGDRRRDLLRFASRIPRHDVIVFQKTYSRWHRKLMQFARSLGKKTVLDLDDAPSRTTSPITLGNVQAMLAAASCTVVGSPNLESYARKFTDRVLLVPSSIRLRNYVVNRTENSRVCLGWIGNGRHYQKDLLQILLEPLRTISADIPVRLKLVGACGVESLYREFATIEGLETELIDSLEWSDPQAVSEAIADFDIGLYPLLPSEFNRFKCGFKALEYMAIGIPVVSSRVSVNEGIIEPGVTGFLADSTQEWTAALRKLACDSNLRQSMGAAGRQKIENQYDIRLAARQWIAELMS